jgi:hypothetical protein
MFNRWTSVKKLSVKERYIAEEVVFNLLIHNLIKQYEDVTTILELLSILSDVFKCNKKIILRTAIKSTELPYSRSTITITLYRAGVPINDIAQHIGVSSKTIYRIVQSYKQNPYELTVANFSKEEHTEIVLFLKQFYELKELI